MISNIQYSSESHQLLFPPFKLHFFPITFDSLSSQVCICFIQDPVVKVSSFENPYKLLIKVALLEVALLEIWHLSKKLAFFDSTYLPGIQMWFLLYFIHLYTFYILFIQMCTCIFYSHVCYSSKSCFLTVVHF